MSAPQPTGPPVPPKQDFYEILGIPRNATKDQVKKAYRKAALKTHPDRAPGDQKKKSEEAFTAVNCAYEILYDDNNRATYDKYGFWPPPPPQTQPAHRQSQPRPSQAQADYAQMYEEQQKRSMHYQFSDPYVMFQRNFADWLNPNFQPFPGRHQRVQPQPPFFDAPHFIPPYAQAQYASFTHVASNFQNPSLSSSQTQTQASTSTQPKPVPVPPRATESPQSSQDEGNGWIKESTVTKMTPQGTRETTIKKTAPDGTIYITRIAGDGKARHFISVNGQERETSREAPVQAPARVPLAQTQPQVQPSSTSRPVPVASKSVPVAPTSSSKGGSTTYAHAPRHSSSASQPVNAVPIVESGKEREAAGHRRSSSRAGNHAPTYATYRATSPPPMDTKQYPFTTYAQAPPPRQRAASPSPDSDRSKSSSKDKDRELRRGQTLPAGILSGAPMPRPQSPHFYRPRRSSDERTRPQIPEATSRRREVREDGPSYVFSDNEGGRSRPAAYRPSRSNQTYPMMPVEGNYVPAPAPVKAPHPLSKEVPRSYQQPPMPVQTQPQQQQRQQQPPPPQKKRSQEAAPVVTNELGLGFVPPPSAGLSTAFPSATISQPLRHSSRNPSYEEILYARPDQGAPVPQQQMHHQQQQQQHGVYGNPMPNPPSMRDPWAAQQQPRYRQAV